MLMYPTFPSPKTKVITAGASALSYGTDTNISTRGIYVSGAGNLTVKNDIGDDVVIPMSANLFLPIVTRYITAYSGSGSIIAFF